MAVTSARHDESTGTVTGRKQYLYDAHMAKQRHEPSWELPKVLRIYYSCISLLLPLLYAASLFPLLQRRFLKKTHLRLCILGYSKRNALLPIIVRCTSLTNVMSASIGGHSYD